MRPQRKPFAIAKLFKNSAFRLSFFSIICALFAAQFLASSRASRNEQRNVKHAVAERGMQNQSDINVRRWLSSGSARMTMSAPLPSGPEGIGTYKADCTTPETRFSTGDVVCALDTNFSSQTKAIYWVNPDGAVVQTDPISAGSPTSLRTVTQAGNWKVYLVGFENEARDLSRFSVSDPQRTTFDLSVFKDSSSTFNAGGVVSYRILAQNAGPDDAAIVQLTEQTPNDATFISSTQDSGPTFTCTPGTGNNVCTIDSLPAGTTASFTFFYQISAGASVDEVISNTVTIQDGTTGGTNPAELHPEDNSWTSENPIVGVSGTSTCSVACPDDVTVQADTTQNNQSGAVVHFSTPVGNTECGVITVDHCNDCFFPEGTTVVTASAATGESCSFNVNVTASTGAATIACPANKTADADSNCSATIDVGTPTATGNNLTVFGVRSDGQPMYNCDCFNDGSPDDACDVHGACTRRTDAPFPAGVTTITWTAISHDIPGPYPDPDTEQAHRTGVASCAQTITVNDVTPPVINATDSSASADANCQATVPDYSNTVTDNCACASADNSDSCAGHSRISVTQSPVAGTTVGLGPHTVHITANDGSSNNGGAGNTSTKDVTFTVNDTTPPTINCPANITANTDPGVCSAVVSPGTATATDNCDSNPTVTGTRSDNQPLIAPYPKGTTTITWTAKDASGNQSSCVQTVTVVDNVPPIIVFNGQIPSMWPPNHSYHTFTAADFIASVSDNCDSLSVSDVYITQVTSDEAENAPGSGNTLNDIVIAADCKSVQMRSERIGSGNGRVYTIYFKLKDSSGNFTTGTAKVYSPRNPGDIPVDDGPQYTVTSSCP